MHLPCEVKGWKLGDGGSRINGAASMSSSGDGYEIRVTEWNLEKEKFSYPMMLLLGGGASPSPSSTGDNGDGDDTYEEDDTTKMSGKFSGGAALP